MTSLHDLAELVRAPAALTVPGDCLAGAAAAGWPHGRRSALLPVASTCLYWAGMALNDYADREQDAVERPERPIPSGRVSPATALAVATGLTAAGVATAALAGGRRSALVAGALAVTVWAYDLSPKTGPLSVAGMATARGLDVLLGAGGPSSSSASSSVRGWAALAPSLAPSLLLATHTASVTGLSRGEVHGSSSATARRALAATAAVGALAPLTAATGRRRGWPRAAVSLAAAALYARTVGTAQRAAVDSPDAATVRRATGAGIRGMVPLQASLLAAGGAPAGAVALAASQWVATAAMRRIAPT